jgi:hypothetical protein
LVSCTIFIYFFIITLSTAIFFISLYLFFLTQEIAVLSQLEHENIVRYIGTEMVVFLSSLVFSLSFYYIQFNLSPWWKNMLHIVLIMCFHGTTFALWSSWFMTVWHSHQPERDERITNLKFWIVFTNHEMIPDWFYTI